MLRQRRGRALAIMLLAIALIALSAQAWSASPPQPALVGASVVQPASVESSAWYCTGMTGATNGLASGTLIMTSTAAASRIVSIRVVNDGGSSAVAKVTIAANGSASFEPSSILQGSWLAADLEVRGGGVAVNQLITGVLGMASAPCMSTVSHKWVFSTGDTTRGHETYLALFNPGSKPAVVSDLFLTANGPAAPQPFQAVVVPAHSTLTQRIGGFLQKVPDFGTVVNALSGQIAASEIVVSSTASLGLLLAAGQIEADVELGIPALSLMDNQRASITIANPSTKALTARIKPHLRSSGLVTPWVLHVPAEGIATVVISDSHRIPANDPCSITIDISGPGAFASWVSSLPSGERSSYGGGSSLALSSAAISDKAVIVAMGLSTHPWLDGLATRQIVVTPLGDSARTSVVLNRVTRSGRVKTIDLGLMTSGAVRVVEQASDRSGFRLAPVYVHAIGRVMVGEILSPTAVPGTATAVALPIAAP